MIHGQTVRLPWALLGAACALLLAALWLQTTGPEAITNVLVLGPTVLAFGAVGGVLAARIPGNPIGWLFLAFSLLNSTSLLAEAYATRIIAGADPVTGSLPAIWVSFWLTEVVPPALLAYALLVFPTGVLATKAARSAAWAIGIATTIAALGAASEPGPMGTLGLVNPYGSLAAARVLGPLPEIALTLVVIGGIGGSAIAVLMRMRRATGDRRQQIKWFACSATLLAVDLVLAGVSTRLLGDPSPAVESISFFVFVVVLSTVPLGMGLAVLRYRLYDIDRVINKTIVYALVTGAVVLVYSATVFVAGTVAAGSGDNLTVAIATLVAAALFRPLLARVQAFVDQRFYRQRYDAEKTVDAFGARLREETDLDELTDDLVRVVRATMQPAHVSVWLQEGRAG
jgi:hypothetical protein